MSLEETKQLLRTHRIAPNKLLGQNFMIEPALYEKMCTYAKLDASDVVLDAGAGFGFLSRFLADKCKEVIAVEKDPHVAEVLGERVKGNSNITVIQGDVLKTALPQFNKVIAIPPYYLSSQLVVWVFERKLDCAVMILQKEFANRLIAPVGSEDYGWLTVFSCLHGEAALLDVVPKELFYPQPEVDSIILALKPWSKNQFQIKDEKFLLQLLKWLFTQRNKKLGKALAPFLRSQLKISKQDAEKIALNVPFCDRRARELSPKDFGELANAIAN
jgi:16S rRNA (adenine1518-N6/adenine1519-N6)-dimethyltransferase